VAGQAYRQPTRAKKRVGHSPIAYDAYDLSIGATKSRGDVTSIEEI